MQQAEVVERLEGQVEAQLR